MSTTNPKLVEKVTRMREEIAECALSFEHKESLYDMISAAAHATNGAPDKLQATSEAILEIALYLGSMRLSDDLGHAELIGEMKKRHDDDCPLRASSLPPKLRCVVPFMWPLTVIFSVAMVTRNLPLILNFIDKVIG